MVNEDEFRKCESVLSKIDKKDFSSTRYRYPFTKQNRSISLEPIDIRFDDIISDISAGIPVLVTNGQKVGVIKKGSRLIADRPSFCISFFGTCMLIHDIIHLVRSGVNNREVKKITRRMN